jgi:hypothetical protein
VVRALRAAQRPHRRARRRGRSVGPVATLVAEATATR